MKPDPVLICLPLLVLFGGALAHPAAWLYFEFRPGVRQTDFRLSNRLLLEARPQQVNTVNLKAGGQRQTFRFNREALEAVLHLPPGRLSE